MYNGVYTCKAVYPHRAQQAYCEHKKCAWKLKVKLKAKSILLYLKNLFVFDF